MQKIERLKDSLHFIAGAGSDAKAGGEDNGSDMGDEEEYGDVFPAHDKDFLGLDEESSTTAASSKLSYSSSATHTIFVDDDEQGKKKERGNC